VISPPVSVFGADDLSCPDLENFSYFYYLLPELFQHSKDVAVHHGRNRAVA
jgi:hypothetical protein